MSAINCNLSRQQVNIGRETNSFVFQTLENTFWGDFCIGQDAGFILRKRAMIVDLWNLVPEPDKNVSFDTDLFFDLPVIYHNGMENTHSFDKQIPIQ